MGRPITFPLTGVIKGWQQGVPGMKVGGTRRLLIPSEMAYGAQSPAPNIPANSDLVFDIELVAIA
jgi:FKBP-type peptidyl-prolyl cis-trans isomerase